jgi:hypothetical protein
MMMTLKITPKKISLGVKVIDDGVLAGGENAANG